MMYAHQSITGLLQGKVIAAVATIPVPITEANQLGLIATCPSLRKARQTIATTPGFVVPRQLVRGFH
jgi:hypothetical protein